MYRIVLLTAALLLCSAAVLDHAGAADIKILSPGSTEAAFGELLPQFEKSSGHKLTIDYGPVGSLAARISRGEAADIVILSKPATEELRQQGKVVDGSQIGFAKVGIGVFIRKGDLKPDIGSVDAFLRALANAKTVAYADPALGGSVSILVGDLLKSLDVTGSVGPKVKLVPPAQPLLDLVAAGGVDFGFNPISQILPDSRLELVGPLPAPIQQYTTYVASLVATSRQPDAYKALMTFLSSPAATVALKARGFEPL
jgi:molybdate transport system substrate-binding protein